MRPLLRPLQSIVWSRCLGDGWGIERKHEQVGFLAFIVERERRGII
jgi:hypothetical protein